MKIWCDRCKSLVTPVAEVSAGKELIYVLCKCGHLMLTIDLERSEDGTDKSGVGD